MLFLERGNHRFERRVNTTHADGAQSKHTWQDSCLPVLFFPELTHIGSQALSLLLLLLTCPFCCTLFQKINHFPGMTEICRKDLLARNLNRMLKLFPKEYSIFPRTWCLPAE